MNRANRKRLVFLGAIGVVVIALVTVVARRDSHSTTRPATGATTHALPVAAAGQNLDANTAQLLSMLHSGEHLTHHGTYRVVGDPAKVGGTLTIELWRLADSAREDTVRRLGTQTVHTISLGLASGDVLCTQTDGDPWTCTKQAPRAPNSTGQGDMLATLPAQLSGRVVTTHRATLDGRKVQCFDAAPLEICVTDSGVPALISSSDIRYELTVLDTNVANGTFMPPVQPS